MSDFHSSLCIHGQVYIFLMRSLDTASFSLSRSLDVSGFLQIHRWGTHCLEQIGSLWADFDLPGWSSGLFLVSLDLASSCWQQFFPEWMSHFSVYTKSTFECKMSPFLSSSLRVDIQLSCSVMSNSLWPHGLQRARLPCPSTTPTACSNSCPSSQWCHPTISSSVVPFSSCCQYLCTKRLPCISYLWELVSPVYLSRWYFRSTSYVSGTVPDLRERGEQDREDPHLRKLAF